MISVLSLYFNTKFTFYNSSSTFFSVPVNLQIRSWRFNFSLWLHYLWTTHSLKGSVLWVQASIQLSTGWLLSVARDRQPSGHQESVFMHYGSACESSVMYFKNTKAKTSFLFAYLEPPGSESQLAGIFRNGTGDCGVLWSLWNTDLISGFSSFLVLWVLWATELKLWYLQRLSEV